MRSQTTFPLYSTTWHFETGGPGGAPLSMEPGDTTVLEGSSTRSEDAFQRLLLKFSAAAAQGVDAPSLIHLFCTATREFFQVDGVYYWQVVSKDELAGSEADGLMVE